MAKSIGIPGIFREDQRAGGVYSVFENLLRGFAELLDSGAATRPFELTVFHGRVAPLHRDQRFHWRRVSDRLGRFAAETRIAAFPGNPLDALLLLNYHTPPVIRAQRAVTIIHDLLYLHMPEYCSRRKLAWLKWCYALALKKCHRVVTISGAVKQDMLRLYGERWNDRIEVIWNPVSVDRFSGNADVNFTNGRPYILCVSVDRPPKNLYRLIKAFALVHKKKFPDHCLVLAGQLRSLRRDWRERSAAVDQTMPAAADLVDELNLGDHVRVTGFISDEQLGALYRGATMCVLPSLFEGFGMPAVESLAMGKPTLVSGLPVLREVTLGAAHYIDDPTDVEAMAERIAAVLDRPAQFQPPPELVERVRESFSPREIARRYLKVLTD
jgi:glycosyltransferase involved in cell wall biosynthesis